LKNCKKTARFAEDCKKTASRIIKKKILLRHNLRKTLSFTTTMKKLIGINIVLFCLTVANAQFSGGNGTENSPYIITTATELAQLATLVNEGNEEFNSSHYKLGNNIDLSDYQSGQGWIPIGTGGYTNQPFKGNFDGNYKKINGLKINAISQNTIGLFGCVSDGKIINLGVDDAEVSVSNASICAGIVAGVISNSTVSNCYSTGTVSANSISNFAYAGGLIGLIAENSTVSNCYSTSTANANTIGDAHTGGFVGAIAGNSTVSNCYSTGMAIANSSNSNAFSGGFAGKLFYGSTLSNCYSIGKVYAESAYEVAYAGGVVGFLEGVQISNCVAINPIVSCSGEYKYYGRVVGYNLWGTISINLGFEDMYNSYGNKWYNVGGSNLDGETVSCKEILADGTFGGRFTSEGCWTTQHGKLPGLFGNVVTFPEHLLLCGYPPIITTIALPNDTVGFAYSYTLTADGTIPIIWSIEVGNLPDGLHLTEGGKISGTPTIDGTSNFTVKAMNDFGYDTKEFSITVYKQTCEPVNDLTLEKLDDKTISLSWSEPESSLEVEGYSVFRNGLLQNEELLVATNYEDKNLSNGNYEYYVVAHYEMGCVADSSNIVKVEIEVGIDEYLHPNFTIIPNPATNQITISSATPFYSVEVFDIYGRKLLEQKTTLTVLLSCDLTVLSSGIYFVRVFFEGGGSVKKLVKQ